MFIVKPYGDELLSSWFIRLARQNYTNVSTMICHIFKDNVLSEHTTKLHIKDIDLYRLNKKQKYILFKTTGIRINNLQLFKYSGFLNEAVDRYRKLWIAEPKASKHNTKLFLGTRFCPKCLEEKSYVRQVWRILLYNICPKHNCYLLCKCQSCNEKFMYYDNGYTRKIHECYNCYFDLRESSVTYVSNTKYLRIQHKLMNILQLGYYKLNNRYYYSIGLFYLLKNLVLSIMHAHNTNIKYIKQLQPFELSKYISHAIFLLEHFPTRLNKYYKKNKLTDINHILHWNDKNARSWKLPNWYLSGIEYTAITKIGNTF